MGDRTIDNTFPSLPTTPCFSIKASSGRKRYFFWLLQSISRPLDALLLSHNPITFLHFCSCQYCKFLTVELHWFTADELEVDAMLKKSSFWPGEHASGALGGLNFRNLGIDSWMRPHQRVEPGISSQPQQNEYYRALAAAALQEFRSTDAPKHSMSHVQPSISSSLTHFRSQSPQLLHQSSHHDASGPHLQLSSSRPQSPLEVGVNMPQCSGYSEGDIHMVSSPSASGSFPLHSMLGRTHLGCDSGQLTQVNRPTLSAQQSPPGPIVHGGNIVREPQVITCNLKLFCFSFGTPSFRTKSCIVIRCCWSGCICRGFCAIAFLRSACHQSKRFSSEDPCS